MRPSLLICTALLVIHAGPLQAQKKLIEFGWDRPSPAFVAANIATMERRPFDGVVLVFTHGAKVFRTAGVDTTALNADAAIIKSIPFLRFTDNFALMGLTPDSTWDWFDDRKWRVSESNVWRFSGAAKAAGLKGIALDYETYGRNPWFYRTLPQGPGRSFADYAAQARKRGRQFMEALKGAYPDQTLLTLFQLSKLAAVTAQPTAEGRDKALQKTSLGLLPAFVTGMLDVADRRMRIVDGNEPAYWYADSAEFTAGTRLVRTGVLPLLPQEVQQTYRERVTVGHSVFTDYLLGLMERPKDTLAIRVAPVDRMKWMEYNVYQALIHADEYAWIYSQKVDWWKGDSMPAGLPEAVERARRAAHTGAPIGISRRDFLH